MNQSWEQSTTGDSLLAARNAQVAAKPATPRSASPMKREENGVGLGKSEEERTLPQTTETAIRPTGMAPSRKLPEVAPQPVVIGEKTLPKQPSKPAETATVPASEATSATPKRHRTPPKPPASLAFEFTEDRLKPAAKEQTKAQSPLPTPRKLPVIPSEAGKPVPTTPRADVSPRSSGQIAKPTHRIPPAPPSAVTSESAAEGRSETSVERKSSLITLESSAFPAVSSPRPQKTTAEVKPESCNAPIIPPAPPLSGAPPVPKAPIFSPSMPLAPVLSMPMSTVPPAPVLSVPKSTIPPAPVLSVSTIPPAPVLSVPKSTIPPAPALSVPNIPPAPVLSAPQRPVSPLCIPSVPPAPLLSAPVIPKSGVPPAPTLSKSGAPQAPALSNPVAPSLLLPRPGAPPLLPIGEKSGINLPKAPVQGSKLRPVRIDALSSDKVKDTIWDSIDPPRLAIDDLEQFFGKQQAKTEPRPTEARNVSKTVSLISDEKRARAYEMAFARIKKTGIDAFERVMLQLDSAEVSENLLETLQTVIPTLEERNSVLDSSEPAEKLNPGSQLLCRICAIPRFGIRLSALKLQRGASDSLSEAVKSCELMLAALEEITASDLLRKFLASVLRVGNALNEGTARGNAAGLKVSCLASVLSTKDNTGKETVLSYLVRVLLAQSPAVASFPQQLPSLQSARKLSLEQVALEVASLKQKVDQISVESTRARASSDEQFAAAVSSWLPRLSSEAERAAAKVRTLREKTALVAKFLGEDSEKILPEELLRMVSEVCEMTNSAVAVATSRLKRRG